MAESTRPRAVLLEICIFAGGLSSRMGRDKSSLRLGRKTLLGHVRAAAGALDAPVRVIRRDQIKRCGPLGGVFTALTTTSAEAVLFLACDMPFVPGTLLRAIIEQHIVFGRAAFTRMDRAGFPFILPKAALPTVANQIQQGRHSLQALAAKLNAEFYEPLLEEVEGLFNVNTPGDWERARQYYRQKY